MSGPVDTRFMHITPPIFVILIATGTAFAGQVNGRNDLIIGAEAAGVAFHVNSLSQKAVSPALAEANANKSRVKTQPTLQREPRFIRPASAIEGGEYGEVFISGILGEDGKLHEPQISISSRSQLIDEQALSDVHSFLFTPARDADGVALKIPINISLEYGHVNFRGENGLAQYRRDQAVKDADWWARTWPADKKDRIYRTIKGAITMKALRSGNVQGARFDEEWGAAIDACRKQPEMRFLELLKPDGDFVRSMTKG